MELLSHGSMHSAAAWYSIDHNRAALPNVAFKYDFVCDSLCMQMEEVIIIPARWFLEMFGISEILGMSNSRTYYEKATGMKQSVSHNRTPHGKQARNILINLFQCG